MAFKGTKITLVPKVLNTILVASGSRNILYSWVELSLKIFN